MSNQKLQVLPPTSMEVGDVLKWIGNCSTEVASKCGEAIAFYRQLQVYHDDLSEMMRELSALQNKDSLEAKEEIKNIVQTVHEICEAIDSLRTDQGFVSENAISLDKIEDEMSETEAGKIALEEVRAEGQAFLTKYNQLKAELGLKTQDDVAKLTGIDRRYISILERGKHKPQFKTLKRIADSFGIPIESFN